jgi:two-component system, chemotaxis family, CheB/CheR fusion protein
VDVAEVLVEVAGRLSYDIESTKTRLVVQENMPTIFCDKIYLAEIFMNLINNAVKFSSKDTKKTPKVEVGYEETPTHHKFFVKDNGIGIAPKFHEDIFDIFRRLHTQQDYEGTGAGLNIVHRIAVNHEGRCWVESDEGKGAAFFFTIAKDLPRQ